MAELNELLAQAADEAGKLSEEADDASESVSEAVAKASALRDQVATRGEEARRLLESLQQALQHGEGEVTAARERADASLGELGTRAAAVRSEVSAMLAKVKTSLDELEQQKARLQEDADTQAREVETALAELADHTQQAGEAVEQQLAAAAATLTAFRGEVETARVELMNRKATWDQAATDLEAQATEQALVWVDGVQQLLAEQATAMIEMTNGIVETHNATMEDLKERFAVQAKEAVVTALQALADELTNLAANAVEEGGNLTTKSDEILAEVRAAVPVIEHLASALDTAAGRL
jgi:chromosome segregation ATPase